MSNSESFKSGQQASFVDPSAAELAEAAIFLALMDGFESLPEELHSQIQRTGTGHWGQDQDERIYE